MKRVTYKINLHCDVDADGVVTPVGDGCSIVSTVNGRTLNMTEYPDMMHVLLVWAGQCLKPLKKNKRKV